MDAFRDASSQFSRRGRLGGGAVVAPAGDLPQAIRPAVEIIARLSAERNRLRAEVAHLRDELSRRPRASEVSRLRAERDALEQKVIELRAQHHVQSGAWSRPASDPLASLVERLERAVFRLEGTPEEGASAGRAAPPPEQQPTRPAAPSARSGGFLAGLVRQNLDLRRSGASDQLKAKGGETS